ncbi:uncharacterized protein RHO25_004714 [Cercospora beticola]|uniref:Uncharacterized protein n=1 Tax=Cercospora beticola TaxID=122368 RepID=A0ABZ0NKV3_CERBT|nr:hypothetical protein RHO25_004714 [Cercospora beticola]
MYTVKTWLFPSDPPTRTDGRPWTGAPEDEGHLPFSDPYDEPLPAVRTEFTGGATIAYGWPSTGGVWIHENCYAVELDFLGVSRFEVSPTQRYSKAEDEFRKYLERIGAHFYDSDSAYNRQSSRRSDRELWYGWTNGVPEGGVWALRTVGAEDAVLGVPRIRNALSMQERCRAIEMLGGTYFEKWEDIKWENPAPRSEP